MTHLAKRCMNCEEYTVQNKWEDTIFWGTILACDR